MSVRHPYHIISASPRLRISGLNDYEYIKIYYNYLFYSSKKNRIYNHEKDKKIL